MKNLFRKLFVLSLISLALPFINCSTRIYPTLAEPYVRKTLPENYKKPKIAYIGFMGFKEELTASYGRRRTYTASLDDRARFLIDPPYGDFGSDELANVNQFRRDIPSPKVRNFVFSYLDSVRQSGLKEMNKYVHVVPRGKEYDYFLRDHQFDYYVIGIHLPAFAESADDENFFHIISFPFSFFTLGVLPFVGKGKAYSTMIVFDKNLNELKRFNYDNRYTEISALWMPASKSCEVLRCLHGDSMKLNRNEHIYSGQIPAIEKDIESVIFK
ncbi:Lp29 family lipoprotein [Leptospira selangorensis]|uniref:Lp29 family lipoprotein n=1 Tax=Leptospira selangorensis TaxID=2484982 RepID=UPI003CC8382D